MKLQSDFHPLQQAGCWSSMHRRMPRLWESFMYEEVLPYVLYPGVIVCGRSSRRNLKSKPIRKSLLLSLASLLVVLELRNRPIFYGRCVTQAGRRIDDRTRLAVICPVVSSTVSGTLGRSRDKKMLRLTLVCCPLGAWKINRLTTDAPWPVEK
jgi:hypothetical protein